MKEGRGSKLKEGLKICLKTYFFEVSGSIFKLVGILSQNSEMEGVLTIQGQIGKIPLQSPGNMNIFPVLTLFFYLSLPKIWLTKPHKDFVFEINKNRTISSKSLAFLN